LAGAPSASSTGSTKGDPELFYLAPRAITGLS
jgi:hypothetical protein